MSIYGSLFGDWCWEVESRASAVTNPFRFLPLLIKPDVRCYRIRLSD